MALAQKRGSNTNNSVELLLHVSDATATRYISTHVKAGRLERIGGTQQPKYRPKKL